MVAYKVTSHQETLAAILLQIQHFPYLQQDSSAGK